LSDRTEDIDVLIPVFNDWQAVELLLPALDAALAAASLTARVVLIDDGSTAAWPEHISISGGAVRNVDVLSLRRNLGHQRALAVGLAWAAEHTRAAFVVVMDGDGEDDPADVPRLVARAREAGGQFVVFAERRRRSETLLFRAFYALYRWTHYLITGIPVRVGNFSVLPRRILSRLAVVSELWNHYAAAVFKARLPRQSIPTSRAKRLAGESRMNFVGLVVHGLSALSVHAEIVGVRLLVACGVAAGCTTALLLSVVAVRVFTSWAVPGWASVLTAVLAMLLAQFLGLAVSFVFLMLGGRAGATFIPLRDYPYFVDGCYAIELGAAPTAVVPPST
jgi:hypothetical protein